jgi:glucose-1-phosphate thymidylyltransferase
MSKHKIKGVVLAGGSGSRLYPLTKCVNKSLLPVYDEPMIHYPIRAMVDAGIDEILVVTSPHHSGSFMTLLGDGSGLGVSNLYVTIQEKPAGIADALRRAESFAGEDRICVFLGDTLIGGSIRHEVNAFQSQSRGGRVFLKNVHDPERFGIAEIREGCLVGIEEKPAQPKSPFAVIGIYLYDNTVFDKIRTLKPSGRGELEITDVNNAYLAEGTLSYGFLDSWWRDAGTFESLKESTELVAADKAKGGKLQLAQAA